VLCMKIKFIRGRVFACAITKGAPKITQLADNQILCNLYRPFSRVDDGFFR
jgi:hypothetical protein